MKQEAQVLLPSFAETIKALGGRLMSPEQQRQAKILRHKAYFKEKYLNIQRRHTRSELFRLQSDHPDWEFKDLLAAVLQDYPVEMPPQVLLMMAQFMVEEWEKAKAGEAVAA